MPEFKYQIGDILQHKCSPGSRLIVLERVRQECPGGVQLHYHVRGATPGMYSVMEHELEPHVPEPTWQQLRAALHSEKPPAKEDHGV